MKLVRIALIARGMPAKNIQHGVFGPDLWLAGFQEKPKIERRGREFLLRRGRPVRSQNCDVLRR